MDPGTAFQATAKAQNPTVGTGDPCPRYVLVRPVSPWQIQTLWSPVKVAGETQVQVWPDGTWCIPGPSTSEGAEAMKRWGWIHMPSNPNKYIFTRHLNSPSSKSMSALRGKLFQSHGAALSKHWSPNQVRVLGTISVHHGWTKMTASDGKTCAENVCCSRQTWDVLASNLGLLAQEWRACIQPINIFVIGPSLWNRIGANDSNSNRITNLFRAPVELQTSHHPKYLTTK